VIREARRKEMRRRGNFIGTRVEGNSTFKKVFGLQEIMKRRKRGLFIGREG